MIDARELRLSNLIYNSEGKELRIVNIGHDMLFAVDNNQVKMSSNRYDFPPETANGIPLTDEWIKRFGFARHINRYHKGDLFVQMMIDESAEVFKTTYAIPYCNIWSIKTDYVHQLQNLYFALTGTELEIK